MKIEGLGNMFLGDGAFLGSHSGVEFKLAPPPFTASETDEGEIVLEDLLDAEVIGEEGLCLNNTVCLKKQIDRFGWAVFWSLNGSAYAA